MSLESLKLATIAAGARSLNTSIKDASTPITSYFEMAENQFIKPGRGVGGNIQYKDEWTQNLENAYTRDKEDMTDPYEGFYLDWAWCQAGLVIDGFEVENNLGGLTIEEIQNRLELLGTLDKGTKNTLFDMFGNRFGRVQKSYVKKRERDFLVNSKFGPLGIDKITAADTAYAGIGHTQLGDTDFIMDLTGKVGALWNPNYRDFGSATITRAHYINAATDMQKMNGSLITVDQEQPWANFLVSTNRYNNGALSEWHNQRRRDSASDVEMTPTQALRDTNHKVNFLISPFMSDEIVYFWLDGTIKKAAQKKRTPADNLVVEKAYGQRILKVTMREQMQYRCDQRWCTGWMKGEI